MGALSGTRAAPAAGLILLVLLAGLLAAGSWRIYSNTWDEPEHLAAGIELLDRGRYEYDTEHPPLGRLFLALGPYLAGARSYGTPPPDGTREGNDILYAGDHYWLYLMLARLGTMPFLVLLLYATWLWARRLLRSQAAAVLAVLLLARCRRSSVTRRWRRLDVAAAATMLLACYALQRWLLSGELRDAAAAGVAAGVAVATKFSAVPFLGLALPVLALAQWLEHARRADPGAARYATAAAGWPALGLAALWRCSCCTSSTRPRATTGCSGIALRLDWAVAYLLTRHGLDHLLGVACRTCGCRASSRIWSTAIIAVKAHNDAGHRSYLLGQMSLTGWWYFYLVALAVKTPLPLLGGGIRPGWMACAAGARGRARARLGAGAAAAAGDDPGVRQHLQPHQHRHPPRVDALSVPGARRGLRAAARVACGGALRAPRAGLAAAGLLAVVLVWQLSTLWRAYPDYLPYFNETVAHPERVLVDSDLDWGQDLGRLELRAAQLQIAQLALAYRGTADLAREPLPPLTILRAAPADHGWVAMSALARTRNPSDYAWLDAYRPLERIGKTIDLYYIP